MSRRIKIVAGASIVVVLLVVLLAGTALAQGPNTAPRTPFGQWGGRGWGPGGMMGGGMMGGWGPGAGGCPGMGGWWGRPSGPMTVTPEQARTYAQQWLDTSLPGTAVADEADAFYGYYTIHVLRDGQIVGMLSVNGYTGQIWYHTWHSDFVGMRELEQ